MKLLFLILLLAISASNALEWDNRSLYPIPDGNLWGYIDKTGTIVIQPQYYAAGQFSEGLAAVRLNGTYGYIDKTGNFVIRPKYDLALPFIDGQAKVFIDGKPFFIDKQGNLTFQHSFKSISSFDNHTFAIAITQTDKYCIINRTGKLMTDTVYQKIHPFTEGRAVVQGLNHLPYPKDSTQLEKYEVGVIDTAGRWVIPYNRYKEINDFKNGYAQVARFDQTEEESSWSSTDAVIDRDGNIKFIIPTGKFLLHDETFNNGLAALMIFPENVNSLQSFYSNHENYHRGVIDTSGKILFSDPEWEEITPFVFNRAFVKYKDQTWKMINTKGDVVGDSIFERIMNESGTYTGDPEGLFTNGTAWVKLSNGWVEIDTMGKFLSQPKLFSGIDDERLSRIGDILLFGKEFRLEDQNSSILYGFWNSKDNSTLAPTYHSIEMDGSNNDLIYAIKNGISYYITPSGKQVWKEREVNNKNENLNIDFMNRSYYYAASKFKKSPKDFGGWGGSGNQSKPITPDINKSIEQLQVIIDPSKKTAWSENYKAMKLFVANTSKDTLYFPAQDSRLDLKIQAMDKNGAWKDIEYLPSSWCGNSYHTLFLAPNELWEFATPIYHGELKTRIRAQLLYKKDIDQEDGYIIFSNEIDSHVNPGQFWNKRAYFPSGLMDSYND